MNGPDPRTARKVDGYRLLRANCKISLPYYYLRSRFLPRTLTGVILTNAEWFCKGNASPSRRSVTFYSLRSRKCCRSEPAITEIYRGTTKQSPGKRYHAHPNPRGLAVPRCCPRSRVESSAGQTSRGSRRSLMWDASLLAVWRRKSTRMVTVHTYWGKPKNAATLPKQWGRLLPSF